MRSRDELGFIREVETAKLFVPHTYFRRKISGGAEGNRTPDLRSAIAALSHLSYSPVEAPAL